MKRVFLVMAVLLVVLISFGITYPRKETVYVGGGMWAPPTNWNPYVPWAAVSGTIGLIYETLYHYDPLRNEFKPWLAEEGTWLDDKTYKITLKKGIKWTDGNELTAKDVKFTFEIAKKFKGLYYSSVWEWLDSIELSSKYSLVFYFKEPRYHEWDHLLYTLPIVPEHIWKDATEKEIMESANENPVGSGPYIAYRWDQDRMVFKRNEDWWGINYFGKPVPKYIVEVRVLSNNVALGMIIKGELDWSNFFLPGVPTLAKYYGIHTWFKKPPYMLSDNTALLFLNVNKEPLNDPNFRKAMAFAIDPSEIVEKVFEKQVLPSNSLGFLPIDSWMKYYDKDVVEEYGFKYSPRKAREILANAGYKDIDGDGFVETKDGKKIKLTIIVPYGWTDWMESIRIIAEQLADVGINAEAKFPDYGKYWEDLTSGKFDMAINNFGSQLSSTPWTYWNWLLNSRIEEHMYNGNFGKYVNQELFDLINEFNKTKDEAKLKEIASKIEKIFLKELPYIPLWYNGLWFQASTAVWTNWPSEENPYAYPCSWGGRWELGGVEMLMHLKAK